MGENFQPRKADILRLRKQGKSYKEIAKRLGCSLGTISYHCGKGQKAKTKANTKKRGWKRHFTKKVSNFKSRCTAEGYRTFRNKLKTFKRKTHARAPSNSRINNITNQYYAEDVITKIGLNPKCYLTGRDIDITDTASYTFDHRVPSTLGGTNDLENLEICCAEANHAKAGLSLDDFYDLCAEILAHRAKQSNK